MKCECPHSLPGDKPPGSKQLELRTEFVHPGRNISPDYKVQLNLVLSPDLRTTDPNAECLIEERINMEDGVQNYRNIRGAGMYGPCRRCGYALEGTIRIQVIPNIEIPEPPPLPPRP